MKFQHFREKDNSNLTCRKYIIVMIVILRIVKIVMDNDSMDYD